jgi:sigma-B regulation protein RsbU (phosphoserine phosphatase)
VISSEIEPRSKAVASPVRVTEFGDGWRCAELGPTGPLLSSIVAGWSWGESTYPFHDGDIFMAFSDGVLEARDPAGRQFDLAGVLATMKSTDLTDGPRLLDALVAQLMRHTGGSPRRDDQTLVYAHRSVAADRVITQLS